MNDVTPKYPSSMPAFHPVLPIPLDFSLQESVIGAAPELAGAYIRNIYDIQNSA
jgi:hypothetical protein